MKFLYLLGKSKKGIILVGWIEYGRHDNLIGSSQITVIYCILEKSYFKEQLGLTITSKYIFVINFVFAQMLHLNSGFSKFLGSQSLFLMKLWVCRSYC